MIGSPEKPVGGRLVAIAAPEKPARGHVLAIGMPQEPPRGRFYRSSPFGTVRADASSRCRPLETAFDETTPQSRSLEAIPPTLVIMLRAVPLHNARALQTRCSLSSLREYTLLEVVKWD